VRRASLAALVLLAALPLRALPLGAQTHVLIVSGLGGETRYSARFRALSLRLSGALHERFGIPDADIVWLGEDSARAAPRYAGQSTKANVERAVEGVAARAKAGAQIVFVLIGHGAGEGADSRLSIPGPDLTAADFERLLARFTAQRLAFVNLTSASGDMLGQLSGADRVVITATKTALERNESHFGEFFVDALAKDVADTDKDGRVSLFEAFRYAAAETKRHYETEGHLQSEHAQLDDDGDKQGTGEPTGRGGDGMLARRFFLDVGRYTARAALGDPRLAALYADRFALEDQLDALRRRKAQLTAEAYDDELERLLVALARKSREIRALEGRT